MDKLESILGIVPTNHPSPPTHRLSFGRLGWETNTAGISPSTLERDGVRPQGTAGRITITPNPTTGLTEISYTLPENTNADKISITDGNGRIISAIQLNGRKTISLDARQWATGVYVVSLLSANTAVASEKLVISR